MSLVGFNKYEKITLYALTSLYSAYCVVFFISAYDRSPRQTLENIFIHSKKPPVDEMSVEYLKGQFNPATHPDFVKVARKYKYRSDAMYLRKETYEAFKEMYEEAKIDGVELEIVYGMQKYEDARKRWEGRSADQFGSRTPLEKNLWFNTAILGVSRFHWGTDISIANTCCSFLDKEEEKRIDWLSRNASRFGFCQPFVKKKKAHQQCYWSYLPLASKFTEQAKLLKAQMIPNYEGLSRAANQKILEDYLLNINPECL